VTPPTHSPLPEDLPSISYIFIQKAGITIGARQPKRPQMETGPSTSPPPQPCLALVSPDLQGTSVVLVVTETTHLVFCSSCRPRAAAGVTTAMMVGPSSLDSGRAEPLSKKAHP
jgi:hypothetical protein